MSPHATAQHFELIDLHPAPTDVSKAVIDGLKRTPSNCRPGCFTTAKAQPYLMPFASNRNTPSPDLRKTF